MQSKVRSSAINSLARREHSRLELKQKLIAKGFDPNEVTQTIETLANQGLQSDERFADSYVNMRYNRGFGPTRIRMELKERGIEQTIINRHLDEDHTIWHESARRVLEKKFGSLKPKNMDQHVKMVRHLTYKGFNNNHIKSLEL